MRVTVVAILETDFKQDPALAKIMNSRLLRVAKELQDIHLVGLQGRRSVVHSLTIQLSYNQKYKIRYRIMNEVPPTIACLVAESCSRLGYIPNRSVVREQSSMPG